MTLIANFNWTNTSGVLFKIPGGPVWEYTNIKLTLIKASLREFIFIPSLRLNWVHTSFGHQGPLHGAIRATWALSPNLTDSLIQKCFLHDRTILHPLGPTLLTQKKPWRLRTVVKKKNQFVEKEVVGVEWVNGWRPRLTFGARHSAPSKVVPPSERLKEERKKITAANRASSPS